VPEWLAVTGAISVVAVAAGVVSGPAIFANVPVALLLPDSPVLITPGGKVSVPLSVPVNTSAVPSSPLPAVSPSALPTEPVRPIPVPADAVPGGQIPPLEVVAPNSCPIGLVLDPVLGVCVSI
jgi:hypothetical protein